MSAMQLLAGLAARSRRSLRRLALSAGLAVAAALSGAVGLGFATYALFEAWRLQYGVINASIGLSVIYFVLALVLFLCLRFVGADRPASAPDGLPGDPLASRSTTQANSADAAAMAMGAEIARQLSPLQLAMVAALSGFIAGRKL